MGWRVMDYTDYLRYQSISDRKRKGEELTQDELSFGADMHKRVKSLSDDELKEVKQESFDYLKSKQFEAEMKREPRGVALPTAGGMVGSGFGRAGGAAVGSLFPPLAPAAIYAGDKAGDWLGTTLGYMADDIVSGRGVNPLEAAEIASEDVATGVGIDALLGSARRVPGVEAGIDRLTQYARPHYDEATQFLSDKAGAAWSAIRGVEPEVVTDDALAAVRQKAVANPQKLTQQEREVLARQELGNVEGLDITRAELGDENALRLQTLATQSPIARHRDEIWDRVEGNKQAYYVYTDGVSLSKTDASWDIQETLDIADQAIKMRDADTFAMASMPEWDNATSRMSASNSLFLNIDDAAPSRAVNSLYASLDKKYHSKVAQYLDIAEELSDERRWRSPLSAPEEIDELRKSVGSMIQELGAKEGKGREIGLLTGMYRNLVEAQSKFLPETMQAEWRDARNRYADYMVHLPKVREFLSDGSADILTIVDKISTKKDGGKLMAAVEFFANEAGRDDIVKVISSAKLSDILMNSSGARTVANKISKLPDNVREKFGEDAISTVIGLAEIEDMLKGVEKKVATPGGGFNRLTSDSIIKYLATGAVSGELYKVYEELTTNAVKKMSAKGAQVLAEIGQRIVRQKAAEAGAHPQALYTEYIEKPSARAELSDIGYGYPNNDTTNIPVPLSVLTGVTP